MGIDPSSEKARAQLSFWQGQNAMIDLMKNEQSMVDFLVGLDCRDKGIDPFDETAEE